MLQKYPKAAGPLLQTYNDLKLGPRFPSFPPARAPLNRSCCSATMGGPRGARRPLVRARRLPGPPPKDGTSAPPRFRCLSGQCRLTLLAPRTTCST